MKLFDLEIRGQWGQSSVHTWRHNIPICMQDIIHAATIYRLILCHQSVDADDKQTDRQADDRQRDMG